MLKGYPLDLVGEQAPTHTHFQMFKTINIVRELSKDAVIVLGPHRAMFPEYAIQRDPMKMHSWRSFKYDAGESMEEFGVSQKNSDGEVQRNPERRSSKTSRLTHGQTADAPISILLSASNCSQWSPQPLPQGATFILPILPDLQAVSIRDIDNILDEMEDCVSLGIKEVHFIDDRFTPNLSGS